MPSLALVGFMGSGKSSLGARVAARLGVPHEDTDTVIEERYGAITEIFANDGEAAFRLIERDVAVAALDEACVAPRVVSLGGGAVLSGDVRDALSRVAHVAWLTAPDDVLWGRVVAMVKDSRPLAANREAFVRLLREREAVYAHVATMRVRNDGSRPEDEVADGIAKLVMRLPGVGTSGSAPARGRRRDDTP